MNIYLKRAFFLITAVFLISTSLPAQQVGWSTGYYAGWVESSYPISKIVWKAYTHLCHFSATPKDDGTVQLDMGLTEESCRTFVNDAHANGVKALLCIGGWGTGKGFINATADASTREKLVGNIIAMMQRYGYDGIDMDWEEIEGHDAEYYSLHQELRTALDKISPRPLMTVAVADWFLDSCYSIHPFVDQMNVMSYWTPVEELDQVMNKFMDRGVPREKLGVGIGLDYQEQGHPEIDCSPDACNSKCRYTARNGFGGIMVWAIEKDALKFKDKTPCHNVLKKFRFQSKKAR